MDPWNVCMYEPTNDDDDDDDDNDDDEIYHRTS
jgi:hypothetical protein